MSSYAKTTARKISNITVKGMTAEKKIKKVSSSGSPKIELAIKSENNKRIAQARKLEIMLTFNED